MFGVDEWAAHDDAGGAACGVPVNHYFGLVQSEYIHGFERGKSI